MYESVIIFLSWTLKQNRWLLSKTRESALQKFTYTENVKVKAKLKVAML